MLITPEKIQRTVKIFFLIAAVVYLGWQANNLYGRPELKIYDPKNNLTVKDSVEIKGKMKVGDSLLIQGQPVFPNKEGIFFYQLSLGEGLQKGENIVEIKAVNKLGRKKIIKRKIFYH